MKTLLVLRHAKSSWSDPELDDHDRPLNKRGKRDTPRMGQLLAREGLLPDLVLSSTAVRARTTARQVLEAAGADCRLHETEALYLADPADHMHLLRELPDGVERAMVVGHNPGIEDLVRSLTGRATRMPTAALAEIRLDIDRWADVVAEPRHTLVRVWRPRELDD